ncbi:MAG: permease prefix domain 1-containing protein, partial [Gemmatimonadales bacterium]
MTPRDPDDFADEIASHLAHEADRLRAQGMNPTEAAAAARRRFGNVTRSREDSRALTRGRWDLSRMTLVGRRLRRTPLFTIAFTAILGFAAAGAGLVFSACYAVKLQPLPFRAPAALVQLMA